MRPTDESLDVFAGLGATLLSASPVQPPSQSRHCLHSGKFSFPFWSLLTHHPPPCPEAASFAVTDDSCTTLVLSGSEVKSLSRVQLFAIPWTGAYHAPLSMGFSRQEYWSGVPFKGYLSPAGWSAVRFGEVKQSLRDSWF